MKKALLIITFILLTIAIPATVFLVKQQQDLRQRAAPATTLYFDPENSAKQIGDIFDLNVMIDTGANNVSAAELHINYNAQYLEMQSLQAGNFLTTVMESPVISNGTASITISKGGSSEIKTGVGILAKITLKALSDTSTPTQLSFSDNTIVTAVQETANVVVGKTPAVITIGTASQPSPTATPQPTPTATPGATPSTTPGATPTATPGASVTPSPSSQITTKINTPTNGSTTSNNRQPISGVSFNNASLTININTNPALTSTFNATSTGTWTYTPTSDMAPGTYNIVLAATNPLDQTLETVTSSFTVSNTGGTNITTPTPNPTVSSNPTTASATPTSNGPTTLVPVTGSTLPTSFILTIAIILLIAGLLPVFFLK